MGNLLDGYAGQMEKAVARIKELEAEVARMRAALDDQTKAVQDYHKGMIEAREAARWLYVELLYSSGTVEEIGERAVDKFGYWLEEE